MKANPENKKSLIVGNKDIKVYILAACKRLGFEFEDVVNYFGDDWEFIKRAYVQRKQPIVVSDRLTEGLILKYCDFLNIDYRILISKHKEIAPDDPKRIIYRRLKLERDANKKN